MFNNIGLSILVRAEQTSVEPHSFLIRNECSLLQSVRIHLTQIFNTCMLRISQFFAESKQDKWYRTVKTNHWTPEFFEQKNITLSTERLRKHGQQLNPTTFLTYLKKCGNCFSVYETEQQEKNVILVETYVLPSNGDNSQAFLTEVKSAIQLAKNLNKEFIAIPIVHKGTFTNHIVTILIKFDHINHKATIEFFDSMGFLPENYKKNGSSLQDLIEDELCKIVENKILENADYKVSIMTTPIVIQKEKVNCGVYIAQRIKMLSDGKETVKPRDMQVAFERIDIEEARETMADELAKHDTKEIRTDLLTRINSNVPSSPSQMTDLPDDFLIV